MYLLWVKDKKIKPGLATYFVYNLKGELLQRETELERCKSRTQIEGGTP